MALCSLLLELRAGDGGAAHDTVAAAPQPDTLHFLEWEKAE